MAYKIDNYSILGSHQFFITNTDITIYVAIESSPERFKVYGSSKHSKGPGVCNEDLLEVAKYGSKIRKEVALKLFPELAAQYTFEG